MGVAVLMIEMFLEPDVEVSDSEDSDGVNDTLTIDVQGPSAS